MKKQAAWPIWSNPLPPPDMEHLLLFRWLTDASLREARLLRFSPGPDAPPEPDAPEEEEAEEEEGEEAEEDEESEDPDARRDRALKETNERRDKAAKEVQERLQKTEEEIVRTFPDREGPAQNVALYRLNAVVYARTGANYHYEMRGNTLTRVDGRLPAEPTPPNGTPRYNPTAEATPGATPGAPAEGSRPLETDGAALRNEVNERLGPNPTREQVESAQTELMLAGMSMRVDASGNPQRGPDGKIIIDIPQNALNRGLVSIAGLLRAIGEISAGKKLGAWRERANAAPGPDRNPIEEHNRNPNRLANVSSTTREIEQPGPTRPGETLPKVRVHDVTIEPRDMSDSLPPQAAAQVGEGLASLLRSTDLGTATLNHDRVSGRITITGASAEVLQRIATVLQQTALPNSAQRTEVLRAGSEKKVCDILVAASPLPDAQRPLVRSAANIKNAPEGKFIVEVNVRSLAGDGTDLNPARVTPTALGVLRAPDMLPNSNDVNGTRSTNPLTLQQLDQFIGQLQARIPPAPR